MNDPANITNAPASQASLDLVLEVAQSLYDGAHHPDQSIAIAGSIAYLSGRLGRAYNTPTGAGLNQYILLLASTGMGKDAVASGVSRLDAAIATNCPSVVDFKGPGQLVSAPGAIKWLERKPCVLSILGEFGKKLKQMSAPNAPSHLVGLGAFLLEVHSKAGHGETFDPIAYSDRDKNTGVIASPSLTIFGESVPAAFYEALDEGMIGDGLLPRFMVFNVEGKRQYRQKSAANYQPPARLVQYLSDVTAHCLGLMHRRECQRVDWTPEAEARFDEFDKWATDAINAEKSQVTRELWNRANLKALKLASVRAIGQNYVKPVITLAHTDWATNLIVAQTNNLIAKFSNGEVGEKAGNQSEQQRLVLWAISEFLQNYNDLEKFFPGNRGYEYASQGVVPFAHISQRIAGYAAFKNDRLGARTALKNTIKELLSENAFICEIPAAQMGTMFGGKGRGFIMADNHAILQILNRP